jgi:hypothetical protein
MIFKMYDCDFGIKLNGVTYDFEHVQDLQIEDPENTRLTRGSNAANKVGLVYKEGISDPKRVTVTIMNEFFERVSIMPAADQERLIGSMHLSLRTSSPR